MKLPAVGIVAAFAGGILLGLFGAPARVVLAPYPALIGGVAFVLIICGIALAMRDRMWPAASVAFLSWILLGSLGGVISRQPLPAEHVLSRIDAQQLPLRTPLRWYGALREEPARLPWGYGFELSLKGVDTANGFLPLAGGMRVGFTPNENDAALPEIHAGDEISLLAEGRLPLVYKDPGAFNRREFLAREDIHLLATLRTSVLLEKVESSKPSIHSRIALLRRQLRERLDAMFAGSPKTASILRAMLLGDRSFVDRTESVEFQKTGTFHVLVLAGLHVGALAAFLFWVGRKLRLSRSWYSLAILVLLFGYVVIVEQRAPVLRAGLMTGIVVVGSLFYRRLELLNSAALAALLLLIAKPAFVTDTGFLLSFLAIGSIAGLAAPIIDGTIQPYVRAVANWRDVTRDVGLRPWQVQFRLDFRDAVGLLTGKLQGRGKQVVERLSTLMASASLRTSEIFLLSLVLQLGMLPMMARDFHRVSLIGPVANSFAVPLTGVIVPLGFLSLGLGMVIPWAAELLVRPLAWLVLLQERIIGWFAAIPHGSYRIPGPPWWLMVAFFVAALLAVIVLRAERPGRWTEAFVAVSFLAAAMMVAIYPFRPSLNRGQLEVTVLDVAQGDSILVVSPRGSTLLIDGGGAFTGFRGREEHLGADPGEEAVSAYLWSRGIRTLDAVALTHGHQDHVGGLTAVLENFGVKRLILGKETAAPAFVRLKETAEQRRVAIEHEQRGQSFQWDGVQVDFLWPEGGAAGEVGAQAKNNDSLVIRLQYGERSVLLPGDAEKQVEYAMLAENDPSLLHADVLKVGHHGSKNSTLPEFLGAIAPQVSIISSGEENPYGHPSPELLERLKASGSRVMRTDRNGEVRVLTDGHDLLVSCFEGCAGRSDANLGTQTPNHD